MSAGSTERCSPSPVREYTQSATTRSSLRSSRPSSWIRAPSYTVSGSSERPFSVTSRTVAAIRSAKVLAPGSALKLRVVVDANVAAPLAAVVRSSSIA